MSETATLQPPTTTEPIHHSMLVSEINQQYPQCLPVFEKYGIAGCGGQHGPPEPLFIFAAAHRVPLRDLVDELNQAVRGEWKDESEERATASIEEAESEILYKRFVFAALAVALTAGFMLGAINLTRIWLARDYAEISGILKQVHGHAQIFGWAGLFIMGVAFHAVPRFKMIGLPSVRAAKACLAFMLAGVTLRSISQPWANHGWCSFAVLGSGLLEAVAISIFLWLLGSLSTRSKQPREFYEKFLAASVLWLGIMGAWNVVALAQMFAHKWAGMPAQTDLWLAHLGLFGFVANMVFGFSLRVVPHFMGLRESKVWPANVAFWLWNTAIVLRYPTAWHRDRLDLAASALELAAAVLFIWSLGIFARRRVQVKITGVDNTFSWFIIMGYVWLLLAAAQPFHADLPRLTASARHAMAVGFITSIMMGVAYRVLPIFNGVNLHSSRTMRASFWLLAFGSTIALGMAYSARIGKPWMFAWTGVAGYCVLLAVALFAWNLVMTLRVKAEKFTRQSIVKLTTRVAELIEVYPDIRPVLIHGGLGGLAAMRHNPPRFVTIEFAARRHGIDPRPLINALNEEIQRRKP